MPPVLSFTVTGSGPPVVILHGLFGSAVNWRRIADTLGHRWQVFSLDLPNHGDSGWTDDMSYPAQAKALASFISDHVPDNPMIIGHSMGGKVAMALALEGGTPLAGLVVVDIAPVAYPHSHQSLVASMKALDLAALRNRRDADRALESDMPDKALRQFLLQNLRTVEGSLRWRINLDVIHRQMEVLTDFDIAPGHSEIPALFVYGTQSDYVTPQITPRIMGRFPNARLLAIHDAGHWLHAEKPNALIDAFKDFAETAKG